LHSHFPHTDDIGVADTLINKNLCDTLSEKYEKYSNIMPVKYLTANLFNYQEDCKKYNDIYSYISIPSHWTYAPFQFIFTKLILSYNHTKYYEEIKYYGRIPSFIFYIIGLILFSYFIISKKYLGIKDLNQASSVILLALLSLELRVLSAQMESYAIGFFSGLVIIISTLKLYQPRKFLDIFIRCIPISIGISMQYQGLFLAMATISSLTILLLTEKSNLIQFKKISYIGICLIIQSIIYMPFLIKNIGYSLNWNAGSSHEFIVSGNTFYLRIFDLFRLLINETIYNLYFIITPIKLEENQIILFGLLFFLLSIMGLIYLYENKSVFINRYIFLYSLIYIFINIILLFIGKISFGPTRHSIYYLLPTLILITYGLSWLKVKFFKYDLSKIFYVFIFSLAIVSIYKFHHFSKERNDLLTKEFIEYNFPVDSFDIIVGDSIEPIFIENIKEKYFNIYSNLNCEKFDKALVGAGMKKLIIYTRDESSEIRNPIFLNKILNGYSKKCGYSEFEIRVGKPYQFRSYPRFDQVDISNKTENGTNSLYLYKGEINFLPKKE
jgi:hypothetical protein